METEFQSQKNNENQQQLEPNMSEEEIKKEVAKDAVEQDTGKTFEEARQLAINVMEAHEGFEKQNAGEAAKEMADIDKKEVQEFQEKMEKTDLADELIQAGLGPKFLSTGAVKLSNSTKTISENTKIYGDGEDMKKMIQDTETKNPNLSKEEVENLTPEEMKKSLENPNVSSDTSQDKSEKKSDPHTEQDDVKNSDESEKENLTSSSHLKDILKETSDLGAIQMNLPSEQKGTEKSMIFKASKLMKNR